MIYTVIAYLSIRQACAPKLLTNPQPPRELQHCEQPTTNLDMWRAARLIPESRNAHPVAARPLCARECTAMPTEPISGVPADADEKRLKLFLTDLSKSFELEVKDKTISPAVVERARYCAALNAFVLFVDGMAPDICIEKLLELASALDDLNDGIQPPLLIPALKEGGDAAKRLRSGARVHLWLLRSTRF